ncbi:hypothetical protein BESB_047410 [Besnoitia besnoiti]|uniref:Tetratricopeptide repeat-containing protein n=1 Tax=Besnoitia besnoiti TaxID=94643 RepID=A0A2A9MF77_BESBE|nr:hypothetical protein BESB_047410 [Besnoitia besnoiti]PFH36549.1 hypothetical protein BESB_047410 [Besnoitia besnoiti]
MTVPSAPAAAAAAPAPVSAPPAPPPSSAPAPLVPAAAASHLQAAVRLIQEARTLHQSPASQEGCAGLASENSSALFEDALPLRISYLCNSALKHLEACGLPFHGVEARGVEPGRVSVQGESPDKEPKREVLLSPRDASRGCLLGFQSLVLLAEAMRSLGKDREAVGCYTESFNWISEAMPIQQRAHALYRAASVMMDVRGKLERQRRRREEEQAQLASDRSSFSRPSSAALSQSEKGKTGRKKRSLAPSAASSFPPPQGRGAPASSESARQDPGDEEGREGGSCDLEVTQPVKKKNERRERAACSRLRLASVLSPPQRPTLLSLTDGESLRYCRRALEYVLLLQPDHAGASARLVKVLLLLGDFGAAAQALKYSLSLGLGSETDRCAAKVRWLLRALQGAAAPNGEKDDERDAKENASRGNAGEQEKREGAVGPMPGAVAGGRALEAAGELAGREKSGEEEAENCFHTQFLEQEKMRIRRQLEELQKEDATLLAGIRGSPPSAAIALSLPPLPSLSSSGKADADGALSLLAFLHSLILVVDGAMKLDQENEAPAPSPSASVAVCRMVSISRSSSALPVSKHLERSLREATRQLGDIFSPFFARARSSSCSSPPSRGGSSSPSPSPSCPGLGLSDSASAKEQQGLSVEGASAASHARRKRDAHAVSRAQQQQRQLLLLQQQQQRSRNRLRQEKPRRLKFLHECDTPVSQLPFAFWKAFGRLMRVPHTHVPSCTPFASYEHMDTLEQVWGDAWALSQLKSSGLSYKILHANATAAAFALAGKSSEKGGDGRSKSGAKRDGRGSGAAGGKAKKADQKAPEGSERDDEEKKGTDDERAPQTAADREAAGSGNGTNEKASEAAAASQEVEKSAQRPPNASQQGSGGRSGGSSVKTSSATAAARGALQGVIAAATGVAGVAAGAPSLQWVLWQLQSAMEGGTNNYACENGGDATPITREDTDVSSLCAEEMREEKAAGERKEQEGDNERHEADGLLLLSRRVQRRVLEAVEGALGGMDQDGKTKMLPLLVVLVRVIEALVSTRSLWQLAPYGLGPAALTASPCRLSVSASSSLTPVAMSCFLSAFVSEGTRRVAAASSFLCSHFSACLSGVEDAGPGGQEGEKDGQAQSVLVKAEEPSSKVLGAGSATLQSAREKSFWWRRERATLQRLQVAGAEPAGAACTGQAETVSAAVGETARVLLIEWYGERRLPRAEGELAPSVSSQFLQIASCLLSAAASAAPYACDGDEGREDEGREDEGSAQKKDAGAESPATSPVSPRSGSAVARPFSASIFHLSQLKDFLEVAGECLYTAAACREMQDRENGSAQESRVGEEENKAAERGAAKQGVAAEERVRFYHPLKKLLAWLALLQRHLAAAVAASSQTKPAEGFLYSLPGDSGEGATGALAAVMLLADLRDEDEAPEEGEGTQRSVDGGEETAATGETTAVEGVKEKAPKEENGGRDTLAGPLPPLHVLRRKAVAAAVAEGMDLELLESLLGAVASPSFARLVSSRAKDSDKKNGEDKDQEATGEDGNAGKQTAALSSSSSTSASPPGAEGEAGDRSGDREETDGDAEAKRACLSVPSCHSSLQRSRACILEALMDTLREEESQLVALSLRLHEQARVHAAEETTAAIGAAATPAQGGVVGGEREEDGSPVADSGREILSSDLQADILFFLHSTVPFLSHITRQLAALSASSLSLSPSRSVFAAADPKKGSRDEGQGGSAAVVPLLVCVSPVLESFFLRLTSLFGDLFSLLALTASRSLDAPLVSSLGAALDPGFSMEGIRRERYGVHDKFLAALCSSLPVFLSSLGAFRRHSLGAAQREASPRTCFDGSAWWSPPLGGGREAGDRAPAETGQGAELGAGAEASAGDIGQDAASGVAPDKCEAASRDDRPGVSSSADNRRLPNLTSQQVLPSFDTPFCLWGVAVPSSVSTAEWLIRGREIAQAEEAEDDDGAFYRLLHSPPLSRAPSTSPLSGDLPSPSKTPSKGSGSSAKASSSASPPHALYAASGASSPTGGTPPMTPDGCYLHTSAARLCVALAAFTLVEMVAVATFCAACSSFLEKKKLPSLPVVAGPVAVTAGGGAGGAGAVFAAGAALVNIARKRGQAWRDFCFSGQLVRWTLHALLYLASAPLEASAAASHHRGSAKCSASGVGDTRERKRKRDSAGVEGTGDRPSGERGGAVEPQWSAVQAAEDAAADEEALLWQLHPLTSVLSVREEEDGCVSFFLDGEASGDSQQGTEPTLAVDGASLGGSSRVEASAEAALTSSSASALGSPSAASPPPQSPSASASSSSAISLLGALGEVLGRNEERGALDGGEYASRLAEVIRLSLEAEMVVRELAGGAGSSQLDGLPGFAGSPFAGAAASSAGGGAGAAAANKLNAGALLLMGEGKVKKGERGERAARAASAAPAAIVMLPEWLTSAYRQEEELPWERKIEEIWIKGNPQLNAYPRPPFAGRSSTTIFGGVETGLGGTKRQLPGLELYLPPGMCTSSLPLAALQVALRAVRPSPVRGFEREILVLAASSSSPSALSSARASSSLSTRPDAEAARAAVRAALSTAEACEGGEEDESDMAEEEVAERRQAREKRRESIERAGARLAPFATMSGSNAFLVVPLTARLLQLHMCATSQRQIELSLVSASSAPRREEEHVGPSDAEQAVDARLEGDSEKPSEPADNVEILYGSRDAPASFCWCASEVPDRLGDLAHSIACCYFLVYGQPVLPRPTPPLDKLVLKTTKEQTRSNFLEISLPAAILGVYVHRAVQKCGPWATELLSKEKDLSISTCLFPSRETREFGRSVVAFSDALVFNSATPPDISMPPCVPAFLRPRPPTAQPPPGPYPPGLSFSLFWAYALDSLVLPDFLRLFLLLVVQQHQLQQSLQVPIPMQQLLQQQTDLLASSSPFGAPISSSVARLFPLPSLRSVCNLERLDEAPLTASQRGAEDLDEAADGGQGERAAQENWQRVAMIRKKIQKNKRTLGAASAAVAAAESLFFDRVQGGGAAALRGSDACEGGGEGSRAETEREDEELQVLQKASAEGSQIFISLENEEKFLSVAPLTALSPYEQNISRLQLYQLLLLLHLLPPSKQQRLLRTHMTDESQREAVLASVSHAGLAGSDSALSVAAARLFCSTSSVAAGSGDARTAASRLSLPALLSLSRHLARAALEAVEAKPLHGIAPSLRGFSLHLLQLLQQAQRAAVSEPEALERAGFAVRAAACAPHNPTLWMAVASLLVELLLLLLDRFCAAGRGGGDSGVLGQCGSEAEETARWIRQIFSPRAPGQASAAGAGGLGACLALASRGPSGSPAYALARGVSGGATGSPGPQAPRGGGWKKADKSGRGALAAGEGERMLSSSLATSVSIASLWNRMGCVGDRAAPNEETLLQLFAHTALVVNLCGEIWLAALRCFYPRLCASSLAARPSAEVRGRADGSEREAKRVRKSEGDAASGEAEAVWERLKAKKLPDAWWIQTCCSGKKIEDPCDLQWRFLAARLDSLLLLFLLWKQFRRTSSSSEKTFYPSVAAEMHRRRWMSVGAESEVLFAKAVLGGRGEGLSARQKEILAALGGSCSAEGDEAKVSFLAFPDSCFESGRPDERKNEEKVLQDSLLVFAARHPATLSAGSDGNEEVMEATGVSEATVDDVQRLKSFILETSRLLRFVFNPSDLALAVSPSLCLGEEEEVEGRPSNVAPADLWSWALVAPLERCKSWVDAETFLWPLPLMRSKWLVRLGLWGLRLPAGPAQAAGPAETRGDGDQSATAPSSAVSSVLDVIEAARAVGCEAASAVAAALREGGDTPSEREQTAQEGACVGDGAEKGTVDRKDAGAPCFSTALFSSALCDAVDALMISCVQAFGAEPMLEPHAQASGEENKKKETTPSKGKRPQGSEPPSPASTGAGEAAPGDEVVMLSSPGSECKVEETEELERRTEIDGGGALRIGEKDIKFVSSRVSLSLFYASLGDMEELVEADGDVLPLAMPLHHLHSLRLKILVLSRGALWRLAALFPWRSAEKPHDKGGKRESKGAAGSSQKAEGEQQDTDAQQADASPPLTLASVAKKRDELLHRWLAGEREGEVVSEFQRLRRGASGLCSNGAEAAGPRDAEEFELIKPFQCPADVVADCIEALQYLALKSRQAGLWTSIPRLHLVNASLASGQPTLALRHLRQLFSRGATKLLPPDAWLSNHYQALKQRRPAYEKSKCRLFHATADTVRLLTHAVLQRTEKTKEDQLAAIRNEEAEKSYNDQQAMQNPASNASAEPGSVTSSGEGEKKDEEKKKLATPQEVAGEGWIFGGLEKVEHLDDLVQGVKFLVEQLDVQTKLLRRLQMHELGTYLQLAFFQDPSPQNTKPGTPFYTLQAQAAQLYQSSNAGFSAAEGRAEKGAAGGSGGGSAGGDRASAQSAANFWFLVGNLGGGAGGSGWQSGGLQSTITDEDGQQANKRMQREVVKILLKGAIDVYDNLVTYCPDVLDMREMHRAITQLFPDVGVPAVEPQNTYVAATASLDGRLLRLLRDAVTCLRNVSPSPVSDLLKQVKQLIRQKAAGGKAEGTGARGAEESTVGVGAPVSQPDGPAGEAGLVREDQADTDLEQMTEKLENLFVSACRKLLYYNPPSPSPPEESAPTSAAGDGSQILQPPAPPAVAVMRLSLGLPVQCGMEVQEIVRVKEALLAYAKATRAGAPSIELFLKSGRVTAAPGGRGGKAAAQGGGDTGKKERGRGGRGAGGGAAQSRVGGASAGGGNADANKVEGAAPKGAETPMMASQSQKRAAGSKEAGAEAKEKAGGERKRRKNEDAVATGAQNKTPANEPENLPAGGEGPDGGVGAASPAPGVECIIELD